MILAAEHRKAELFVLQGWRIAGNQALGSSEELSHRLTSHRIGLASFHRLNYTFIII